MPITNCIFIQDRSWPTLTTTTTSAVDLQVSVEFRKLLVKHGEEEGF